MEWIIAVVAWQDNIGTLLLQRDDETLFTLRVSDMSPNHIAKVIANKFGIPKKRVMYHETYQKNYRRYTYMKFLVLE